MSVGEGGGTVAATVEVGLKVAGTGVEVVPEQATSVTAKIDMKSIGAKWRPKVFGRRFFGRLLKMPNLFVRTPACRWM